jgi:putative endonuclease
MITTRETGQIGENIACKWLESHGFLVVQRNYLKKWGELDIIATKDKILHFVEVKSVPKALIRVKTIVLKKMSMNLKIRRLRRTIQTYLLEKHYTVEAKFQFHVLTVEMNEKTRRAHVNFLENIVL